jgi:hypothetical protein
MGYLFTSEAGRFGWEATDIAAAIAGLVPSARAVS